LLPFRSSNNKDVVDVLDKLNEGKFVSLGESEFESLFSHTTITGSELKLVKEEVKLCWLVVLTLTKVHINFPECKGLDVEKYVVFPLDECFILAVGERDIDLNPLLEVTECSGELCKLFFTNFYNINVF